MLSTRLGTDEKAGSCVCIFFFFFFFFRCAFYACGVFLVGPVHCLRDPQTSFLNKTFIKNWFYSTIHIFKNYFVTVFLVFSKISDI